MVLGGIIGMITAGYLQYRTSMAGSVTPTYTNGKQNGVSTIGSPRESYWLLPLNNLVIF